MKNFNAFIYCLLALALMLCSASALEFGKSAILTGSLFIAGIICTRKAVKILDQLNK